MSKERLEEIEERVIYGTDSEDMKVDVWVELKDYEYLKEQAERVQELEWERDEWLRGRFMSVKHSVDFKELEEQNKRYRKAIESTINELKDNPVTPFNIFNAREALENSLESDSV